jgi:hypothetical protein
MPKMLPGIRDAQMISAARLLSVIAMLNLCWLECAQNPAVFCYRIGWDLLAPLCVNRGAAGTCRRHARANPQPSA